MELKLKTEIIKDMVSKIVKGVGNNKLIPLTSMIAIEAKDNTLRFIATDATQYLVVTENNVPTDDFYVVVQAEQFAKLIAKMTCAEVSLKLEDNYLVVGGNGTYKIDIPMDESGSSIKFPTPFEEVNIEKSVSVPTSVLRLIVNSCLPAVAATFEEPCYTGVYIGSSIMATDTQKICSIDKNILDGSDVLVSADTVKLFPIFGNDAVDFSIAESGELIIEDDNIMIYTPQLFGIEDYAISDILPLLNQQFTGSCKVSRGELITLLDRIALFVGVYDNGAIELTFTDTELQVVSKQSNGVESIKYQSKCEFEGEFKCWIDVNMLLEQLKAQNSSNVEMFFGMEKALKMSDEQIVQLIALLI